jgi:hypothetical protein
MNEAGLFFLLTLSWLVTRIIAVKTSGGFLDVLMLGLEKSIFLTVI